MDHTRVWTFLYGGYLNLNVLKEFDVVPESYEIVKLQGFDISIRPMANLFRDERSCVYGINATATHEELQRLYSLAENGLGRMYFPEAVITGTLDGTNRPVLCYLAPSLESKPASNEYIDRIVNPAREYGFPDWYIEKLESFRP